MSHLPNFKIEQLIQQLADIDLEIEKHAVNLDDRQVRMSIDTRRQLLASLTRESLSNKVTATRPNEPAYAPHPDITEFIDAWCDRIKTKKIETVSYQSSEFCHLLLDHILPKAWNFDEDLIIVHQPQSKVVLDALHTRHQNHIIICNIARPVPDDVRAFSAQHKIPIATSIENLERNVSLLQTRAKQVISITCEIDPANAKEAKLDITKAVNAGKRTRIENTSTASKFGKSWAINILKNMPKFHEAKNLHQLKISGVEDAVVVASGPSLGKNVARLSDIQDKVFIVSALRSLPVLNAAGIDPDLVIQLDAEDDEIAQKLSPDPSRPIKNLLLEGTVNTGFFNIPSKNTIWSLAQHFFDIHQRFDTKPTPFNVPSVSIYGLSLCQFLNFKNICFVGQDLAASAGKQYADGATSLLPAHANLSMFQIEVPGFYGDTVMTRNSYEYQIKRCSEIAREWRSQQIDINLVNATEGGAFIPEFDHMSLDAFIEQRQILTRKTNKSVEFSDNFSITPDVIKSYLSDLYGTMDRISKIAEMIIKLDVKPEKNRSLDKKIKKMIQKFQDLNNRTSLLQIAMQEGISKVIGTSRTTEPVDTYSQFFAKIKDTASTLKSASKQ